MITIERLDNTSKYLFSNQDLEEVLLIKNTSTQTLRLLRSTLNSSDLIEIYNLSYYSYLKNTIPKNSEDYSQGFWTDIYEYDKVLLLEPEEFIPLIVGLKVNNTETSNLDLKSLGITVLWVEE